MPAPSDSLSYHVTGPVTIYATVGSAAAWMAVGHCKDGADIELRPFTHDVKWDGGGGPDGDAVEVIALNFTAIIRCSFVPFSGNAVNRLRARSQASGSMTTDGVMPVPGTLYGTNGYLVGVRFTSGDVDGGWQFGNSGSGNGICQVIAPGSARYNTKETEPQWQFRAINFINPALVASIGTAVLYTRF